jgi:hypothetical protein
VDYYIHGTSSVHLPDCQVKREIKILFLVIFVRNKNVYELHGILLFVGGQVELIRN